MTYTIPVTGIYTITSDYYTEDRSVPGIMTVKLADLTVKYCTRTGKVLSLDYF